MPNLFARTLLFLSSYFPLTVIFALRNYSACYTAAMCVLAVGCVSLLVLLVYFRKAKSLQPVQLTVAEVHSKNAEAMSYLVTYVIPFVELPVDDWKKLTSLLVFFLVIGVIYISSNMIHINPMLNFFGLNIFEVRNPQGYTFALICRRNHLQLNETLNVRQLGHELMFEG
ncbi:MAG TPA: hypothetical protein VGP72_00480 [Planctomycetota bacterium]|jgi:hypothetical protein